jgi:pimeloyl-ACP methyl ester carboxylesterase
LLLDYSYVNDAVDQYGYSTFAWDRLGIGQSSHGNPLTEIPALLEVDALRALTVALRAGKISGISTPFDTVVHVGHSFGSEHTFVSRI